MKKKSPNEVTWREKIDFFSVFLLVANHIQVFIEWSRKRKQIFLSTTIWHFDYVLWQTKTNTELLVLLQNEQRAFFLYAIIDVSVSKHTYIMRRLVSPIVITDIKSNQHNDMQYNNSILGVSRFGISISTWKYIWKLICV